MDLQQPRQKTPSWQVTKLSTSEQRWVLPEQLREQVTLRRGAVAQDGTDVKSQLEGGEKAVCPRDDAR
jgi:hypothetical protein